MLQLFSSNPFEIVENLEKLTQGEFFFLVIIRPELTEGPAKRVRKQYLDRVKKRFELMEFWTTLNKSSHS